MESVYYNNDLAFSAQDTIHEDIFANHIKNLLKEYDKQTLLTYSQNLNLFNILFTTNEISDKKLHFILLKKFYLSPQTNSPFARELSIFLDREDFVLLEQKIKYDPNIRKTLIANYMDNAQLSNHHLAVNKAWDSDYDEVHRVLSSLNNFYLHRNINPTPQLKKSFYN